MTCCPAVNTYATLNYSKENRKEINKQRNLHPDQKITARQQLLKENFLEEGTTCHVVPWAKSTAP